MTTKQVIYDMAKKQGYEGGEPRTTTDAINALTDMLAGEDVEEGHTIKDALIALAPYVNAGGGGEGDSGDRTDPIRFFDYDGRLVASYKAVPSELPEVPTHDKLTNGTWNYTIEQVAEQFDAAGKCDVGANYDTVSGKTEIDVRLDSAHLKPTLCVAINGNAKVDWGDGTSPDIYVGTSSSTLVYLSHTYQQAGEYTISVSIPVGFWGEAGLTSILRSVGGTSGNRRMSTSYADSVVAVRVSKNSFIGGYAFADCHSLQYVSMPTSVKISSSGNSAFSGCSALQSVSFPSGVTTIGDNAFNGCRALESVTIPASVTSVGSSAFNGCHALQSVTIPASVTSIGNSAFSNCQSLQSVTIPAGVTSIGDRMFSACYALQSVTIPASVTSIGAIAFVDCRGLQSVTIPASVTSIGASVFNSCGLKSVTIPAGVTSIGDSMFSDCSALQSVTMPVGVTRIGNGAFSNCQSLQSVTIPAGVTSIEGRAFSFCRGLQSVTIPASVTSIGNSAFSDCYGTYEYHLEPTTPPTLGTTAFSDIVEGTIIYVPKGCLEAYQTATNWKTYASYMQEEA